MKGKRERIEIFIILLGNLYHFIRVVCKNKNWDCRVSCKWVSKIDKVVFEDAK